MTEMFSAFVAHYRLGRFCSPYSGSGRAAWKAVHFTAQSHGAAHAPRRNRMVVGPSPAGAVTGSPRIVLPEVAGHCRPRCSTRRGAALMPAVAVTAFGPVHLRKASWPTSTGCGRHRLRRYLAGPDSARSLAAIRWDTVARIARRPRKLLAEYPRQYGRSRNGGSRAPCFPGSLVEARAWRKARSARRARRYARVAVP